MRVLFVSLIESHWGGSEVLWSRTAMHLADSGHSVAAFLGYYKRPPPVVALEAAGVEVAYGTPPPTRWWNRVFRARADARKRFGDFLARYRPDLVVFSQGGLREGLAEMEMCRILGRHYAILNQLAEPRFFDDNFVRSLEANFRSARRVWFVSRENREWVNGLLGSDMPHAAVIPNAYACEYQPRLPWPAVDLPRRLALVARLEPDQKGQDMVIDILSEPAWRERAVEITFFGDGPAAGLLKTRCARRGLSRIRFAGRAASPADIWNEHHALLMPSRYEGQSLAMIEAMLHGRPVIATPVGGTCGLLQDDRNAFVAERVDAAAYAVAMERAWERRAEWRVLGLNAAADARAHVWPDPGRTLGEQIVLLSAEAK